VWTLSQVHVASAVPHSDKGDEGRRAKANNLNPWGIGGGLLPQERELSELLQVTHVAPRLGVRARTLFLPWSSWTGSPPPPHNSSSVPSLFLMPLLHARWPVVMKMEFSVKGFQFKASHPLSGPTAPFW